MDNLFELNDDATINENMAGGARDKYVNLTQNGKMLPTWVLANFNKYKLPELFLGDDPCNDKKRSGELRKYQDFLGKYLDFNSPYRDILIYHGLGSGKTRSAINIYNVLYNSSPDWNVFVLLKATLKESTWYGELDRWLSKDEKDFRSENIHFISYDAPNADKLFLETMKNVDSSKKSLYVIEESHNFINNVYTNLSSQQGRRALTIYEYIIQEKKDNDDVRVVMISGSPAINIPFELGLMFNLLRPGIFPKTEAEFNDMYIANTGYPTINPTKKNSFMRRILGLVSYYIGATPDYFAKKVDHYINVPMSKYQEDIYTHYEKIEREMARKSRGTSGNYMAYTRQSCNFVFPPMGQGMNGITRPRPRDFKVKDTEVMAVTKGKTKEKEKEKYYKVNEYLVETEKYIDELDKFFGKHNMKDEKNGHTIMDDIDALKSINEEYDEITLHAYMNGKHKRSNLLENMYMCSAKITLLVLIIMRSPGPSQVYSNYVVMEGLQVFKVYLKHFGFTKFIPGKATGKDGFRYTEYHGGIDGSERRKVIEAFNRSANIKGEVCKIIMISPAGAEGISLNNVRQVHIMEPYWHEVRIMQMIGRAIRQCSHKNLPMSDRVVDVYRYKSVKANETSMTSDQFIEDMARSKENLIQSFLDALKSAAVDCELNKNHNHLGSNYRCFKFEERSLFAKQIGPAYAIDLHEDERLDNGLDAPNTDVKRIKIIKISAVIETGEGKYSKPADYWYSPETHSVYDYDTERLYGRVGVDMDDIPMKLDKDTYIITHTIPIPLIKNK
jgi:superfamily II DNA or RNA helicase